MTMEERYRKVKTGVTHAEKHWGMGFLKAADRFDILWILLSCEPARRLDGTNHRPSIASL